ncbi:unnamed protein product [Onchocerca flexuosa]|uniref:SUI1 domain-containing protein n=1 Tax=Onchocerca flexuosa TaxID=387005 RepID=A0A183HIF7_9BILA|nr:unnamed protein product [Onchocerca flexuosa]
MYVNQQGMQQGKAKDLFIAITFGGDRVFGQRELICIIMMHCDLLEQISEGQILTKKMIKPGKMVIVGDIDEDDVIESINQLAKSMKTKF